MWIAKVKTNKWLDSLRNKFGEDALIEDMKNK